MGHADRGDRQEASVPNVIEPVDLKGSYAERIATLNAAIVRLQEIRAALLGEPWPQGKAPALHGPHIDAPLWPWFAAGWLVGAMFVLLFVWAWVRS